MIWHSASDFFAMGGYGLYVWGSMAVVALCLGAETVLLARRAAGARALLAALPARVRGHRHSQGVQDEVTP